MFEKSTKMTVVFLLALTVVAESMELNKLEAIVQAQVGRKTESPR